MDCSSNQVDRKRAIQGFTDANSPTKFSICHGQYPVCWRGLSYLTGVSCTLLACVVGTPKARQDIIAVLEIFEPF